MTKIQEGEAVASDTPDTLMRAEAAEAGAAVARFLAVNHTVLDQIGQRLRQAPPEVVVTVARGSSDHAASFAKYLIETRVGIVTASAALSVSSVYPKPSFTPRAQQNRLCLAISQSGRSPDLLESVAAQKAAGAFVVAIVNATGSPLADLADATLALEAGPELSVAATKSFIGSLAAIAALVGHWTEDRELLDAVERLPNLLPAAFAKDWGAALPILNDASNLFVLGRGYSFAVAQEAALKLKETCGLHAEAYSSAEVKHGPMAIIGDGFPILAMAGSDGAGDDVRDTAALFADRGARVALADASARAGILPADDDHPVIEPILMIQSFYALAEKLSRARGFDPDRPPFLNKVTKTK